ncbi:hypothetical protein [Plantactinospora sp. WMMB782]|uniref:hypothetical protein n=1 Tax=Plantactinospora sp. WMMB782 TaxID=3404121 RepID=UPI003B931793
MAVETSDRHRTTCRNMRVSVLLILITVGLPGCATGTGTGRPPSVRHPAANPAPPAEPAPADPDPEPAHSAGHRDPANSAGHGDPANSAGHGAAALSTPDATASSTPGPAMPAAPGAAAAAPDTDAERGWPEWRGRSWHRLPARGSRAGTAGTSGPASRPGDDSRGGYPTPAGPAPEPAGTGERRAGPAPHTDGPPPGYRRSLAYSGLLGLVISAVGLVMVGTRRRYW